MVSIRLTAPRGSNGVGTLQAQALRLILTGGGAERREGRGSALFRNGRGRAIVSTQHHGVRGEKRRIGGLGV